MQRLPSPFESRSQVLPSAAGGGSTSSTCSSSCVATLVASVGLPHAVFKRLVNDGTVTALPHARPGVEASAAPVVLPADSADIAQRRHPEDRSGAPAPAGTPQVQTSEEQGYPPIAVQAETQNPHTPLPMPPAEAVPRTPAALVADAPHVHADANANVDSHPAAEPVGMPDPARPSTADRLDAPPRAVPALAPVAPGRHAFTRGAAWGHAWAVLGALALGAVLVAALADVLGVAAAVLPLALVLAVFARAYRQAGRSPGDGVLAGIGVQVLIAITLVVEVAIWMALILA